MQIPSEGVQPAYYGYIGSSERYYVSEVVHDPSTQVRADRSVYRTLNPCSMHTQQSSRSNSRQ